MRLFLVQCCSAKGGDREIFGEQRSVLADLPPADAKSLIAIDLSRPVHRFPVQQSHEATTA